LVLNENDCQIDFFNSAAKILANSLYDMLLCFASEHDSFTCFMALLSGTGHRFFTPRGRCFAIDQEVTADP